MRHFTLFSRNCRELRTIMQRSEAFPTPKERCVHLIMYCILLLSATVTFATEHVSYEQLQTNGWDKYIGKQICITTPLVVCGNFYDSLYLAPQRLYVPEEHAIGLQKGDSSMYWKEAAWNRATRIKIECPKPYDLNLGATVKNLKARVTGVRSLQTGKQPSFRNLRPSKRLPDMQGTDIIVCSANIQNYFVHQGGYATKRNTNGQHALQCYKVAAAFAHINADLYTICELEKGDSAPKELTSMLTRLSRQRNYNYVSTGASDADTISVGLIYDTQRLRPYGELRFAYPDRNNIFAYRFLLQGFEDIATGERFVVSVNHLRSKRGTAQESCQKRRNNSHALLRCIREAYTDSIYTDPDILIVGDFNSYAYEAPLQDIVNAGYQDILMQTDSLGYSYCYKGECGYLDRVYASPTMAQQITTAHPIHWNTDIYYSAAYYSKYNFKKQQIPTNAPNDIRRLMSCAAKKNLIFRYSDHDPILIGIKLGK
mgnify:CR=1 FL=1